MICDKIVRLGQDVSLSQYTDEVLADYLQYALYTEPSSTDDDIEPVRIFSWDTDPNTESKTFPFFWLRNNRSDTSATEWAEQCAADFATKRIGERCLFIWKPNSTIGYPDVIENQEYHKMLKDGPNLESKAFFDEFFNELNLRGQTPDIIVLDFEGGLTLYGNNDDKQKINEMDQILSNPDLVTKLPEYFSDAKADWVTSSSSERHNFNHNWSLWSDPFVAESMKKVVYDAYFEVYGVEIPYSNYGDKNRGFPVLAWNGRINSHPVTGTGCSAPANYLIIRGSGYAADLDAWKKGKGKHPRWSIFIDTLNGIRSCITSEGPRRVMPWISCLGYETQHNKHELAPSFLDLHLHSHCIMSGISVFHFWNPGPPSQWSDDKRKESSQYYSELAIALANARKTIPEDTIWEPVDRDVDFVITNGFKTTYADFEKNGISARDYL